MTAGEKELLVHPRMPTIPVLILCKSPENKRTPEPKELSFTLGFITAIVVNGSNLRFVWVKDEFPAEWTKKPLLSK